MAKALAAKAHIDRLDILIDDLSSQQSQQVDNSISKVDSKPDSSSGSSNQIELDLMPSLINDDTFEPNIGYEKTENKDNKDISHQEFLSLSSQIMPILESIFTQECGKKLHISYLYKAVNQKSLLGLSQEAMGTFLAKAVMSGYCERDIYDKDCYFSLPDKSDSVDIPSTNNPYKKTLDGLAINQEVKSNNDEEEKEDEQEKSKKYVVFSKTKPNHNLPFSPHVKMNLLETIDGYISECQPKTFTPQDLLNYLYSEEQQEQWTDNQKKDNFICIKNALKYYSKKNHFLRVRNGVYQPLSNDN